MNFIGFVEIDGVGRIWSEDRQKILCNVENTENDDGIQQIMMDKGDLIRSGIAVEETSASTLESSSADMSLDSFVWNKTLVTMLIETRIDMDASFQGNKCKKGVLWTKVANKINTSFPNYAPVNADKCDSKWRNLWVTYKANVKKSNLSGRDSVTWEYYDVLDEHFGDKPNVRPPSNTLISTLNLSCTSNEDDPSSESFENTLDTTSTHSIISNKTKHITMQESNKKIKTGFGMADYISLKKKELEQQNDIQKKLLELKEKEVDALVTMSQALKAMAEKVNHI